MHENNDPKTRALRYLQRERRGYRIGITGTEREVLGNRQAVSRILLKQTWETGQTMTIVLDCVKWQIIFWRESARLWKPIKIEPNTYSCGSIDYQLIAP